MSSRPLILILACLCISAFTIAQDSSRIEKVLNLPSKFTANLNSKLFRLEKKIFEKTERTLKQLSREERKLKKKLAKKDSVLAAQIFSDPQSTYENLRRQLKDLPDNITPRQKEYIPLIDTFSTSIRFLQQTGSSNSKLLDQTLGSINGIEGRLYQVKQVQEILRQRRQFLRNQLGKLGMVRYLKAYSNQVWYYQAQIAEYKSILKEPEKIERKALAMLSMSKPFQNFMSKYSTLASLFPAPEGAGGSTASMASLAGLQTRDQVTNIIQQAIGAGGPGALQRIQRNIMQAQSELASLKDKLKSYSFSNSDEPIDMPEYKVNTQRTKTFWDRWELGTNIQSTARNKWLPTASDLGLSAGFKINDRSVIGCGISGRVGWGKDIRHIAVTYEGVGARTFADWKIKGSFWMAAGYEFNYNTSFRRLEELQAINAWQRSGMVGITKKIQIGKKLKASTSLLWDFLSYQQIPRTQPIKFRVGYTWR